MRSALKCIGVESSRSGVEVCRRKIKDDAEDLEADASTDDGIEIAISLFFLSLPLSFSRGRHGPNPV